MGALKLPSPVLAIFTVVLAGAFFYIDLLLPGDAAGGVLFIGVVLLGWWYPHRYYIFLLAGVSTIFIVLTHVFLMGPNDTHGAMGSESRWIMEVNHIFSVIAIWVLAFVQNHARKKSDQLASSRAETIRAMEAAEGANRAKSEFLSSMSHELRTPMNAIIGFGEMMVHNPKEELNENQKEYTGYILQSAHHLLDLINDVLELSKIESGVVDLELDDMAVDDAIVEAIRLIEDRAIAKNVTLGFDGPETCNCLVVADPVRLRQVLLNLLSNAIKYNNDGGWVKVNCVCSLETNMRIEISDNGRGIPADQQGSVFQAFNRLGRESGPVEGTGIGLTITRDLVLRMNGSIGFESKPGEGTTFWVELPKSIPLGTS